MLDFAHFQVLTFDCYGTLINWESGILNALRPLLKVHGTALDDERILELYAEVESREEERHYTTYKDVLRRVVEAFGKKMGFAPSRAELECLVKSIGYWRPFPDTLAALHAFKKRYRLAIISNVDDDLFALSAKHLLVDFDWIITAEQAKSYKPSLPIFQLALNRIAVSRKRILHIAQSLYHDIVPAKAMGVSTVWVNRRRGKGGFGATPPASSRPDLETEDLRTLVSVMGLDKA